MKSDLRHKCKEIRDNLDEEFIKNANEEIFSRIINLDVFKNAKTVMTYISVGSEVDTRRLMEYCIKCGKKLLVPVIVKGTHIMEASYLNSISDLKEGTFGIPEPKKWNICRKDEIDLCIVPALAYDKNNFRLGYGGGFYDRFLTDFKGVSVGLEFSKLILGGVCPENYDMPVDIIVTEKEGTTWKKD